VPELVTTLAATEADRLLQAEAAVRAYCGWHIAPARTEVELTLDGSGSTVLLLPTLKLTDLLSVTEEEEPVDLTDVEWTEAGCLRRETPWTCKLRGVIVTIDHGHAAAPPEVTAVVQAIAQRAINNPGSLLSKTIGPFSETHSQTAGNQALPVTMLDAEKAILARYKLPPRS
jgi:hypothetical protein